MKIAVIVPTYNEKENINLLVTKLKRLNKSLGIFIVDDNSPDGTGKIADKLSRKYSSVFVLHRSEKLGLGTAYKAGFKEAIKRKFDVLITMDADLSHDPNIIPRMIKKINDSDIVIGSRYIKGGRIVGFDSFRYLVSGLAQYFSKYLLGLETLDSTSGFRVYKAKVLKIIDIYSIKSNGYSFLIEAIYRCNYKKLKIAEVPITFLVRRKGKSKLSEKEIYNALITITRLFIKRIQFFN